MKIGLLGESPNDTLAIKNLLSKKYNHRYETVLNSITGDNLKVTERIKNLLKTEIQFKKYDFIIFIRDLDSLKDNSKFFKEKNKWFIELNSISGGNGIFLLNIYEIEALIFADIMNYNKYFSSNVKPVSDPMSIKEPKEKLQSESKSFDVNNMANIFKVLDINNLTNNCQYFKDFIEVFEQKINKLKPKKVKNKILKPKKKIKSN